MWRGIGQGEEGPAANGEGQDAIRGRITRASAR